MYIVPGPPEDLRIRVLNVAVEISWEPPLMPNGIITFYNITYNGSRYKTLPVSKGTICICITNPVVITVELMKNRISFTGMLVLLISKTDYDFNP